MPKDVLEAIAASRGYVIDLQTRLVAIPAVGPANSGQGEEAKAEYLRGCLRELGLSDIIEMPSPDERVPGGARPNIAAVLPGRDTSRTLWVIGHMDVVPPGDRALWDTDPYELKVDGDYLYGRGVEDNHQAIVSTLAAAKGFVDTGAVPSMNLGLLFVSDEETGSRHGLEHVVENHADLFKKSDLFLVPDFGTPDSELVEIAEKSLLWLKIVVKGRQCHASTPSQGVNSLVPAAEHILMISRLEEKFKEADGLFDPPTSTFQPTRKDANVENVNTIPGRDVFYVDCRVLPGIDPDLVMAEVEAMGREIEAKYGVKVELSVDHLEKAAPATPEDAEVVARLIPAIKAEYGNTPRPAGIGGGTVAAILRKAGYHAVVWATCEHNAHQPNERTRVSSNLGDARVIARMLG